MAAMTKGQGFRNVHEFTVTRFGVSAWPEVVSTLSATDQQIVAGVVPVGWYELSTYAHLLHALAHAYGHDDLSLIEDVGRYSANVDLTTIHRLFMRVANPGVILSKAMQLWRRFHDSGDWHVATSPKRAVGTLTDWGCVDAALCRELIGYIEVLLELGNSREVRVQHTSCRALGDRDCVWVSTWL